MTETIVDQELLKKLEAGKVTLDHGDHLDPEEGHCAMEVVSMLAGEELTDAPDCASPVLGGITRRLNDQWDDEQRQKLLPLLPRMIGTADDGKDEARSYTASDWLVRIYTPAWLELAGLKKEARELRDLSRIVDPVSAERAGDTVRSVRDKALDGVREVGPITKNAARATAGGATREAADVVVRNTALAAAGNAAWASIGAAAGVAARDAGLAAAGIAAWEAARDAARDDLQPTVEELQTSALDLLDRMIDPSIETEVLDGRVPA